MSKRPLLHASCFCQRERAADGLGSVIGDVNFTLVTKGKFGEILTLTFTYMRGCKYLLK